MLFFVFRLNCFSKRGGEQMLLDSNKMLNLLSSKDVAKVLKCSLPTARKIMKQNEDFALNKIGREYRVSEESFINWCNKRHIL